jgi:hypothetical protein
MPGYSKTQFSEDSAAMDASSNSSFSPHQLYRRQAMHCIQDVQDFRCGSPLVNGLEKSMMDHMHLQYLQSTVMQLKLLPV